MDPYHRARRRDRGGGVRELLVDRHVRPPPLPTKRNRPDRVVVQGRLLLIAAVGMCRVHEVDLHLGAGQLAQLLEQTQAVGQTADPHFQMFARQDADAEIEERAAQDQALAPATDRERLIGPGDEAGIEMIDSDVGLTWCS